MPTQNTYADYTDSHLEDLCLYYGKQAAEHHNYAELARELAAAHKEIDLPSNAEDMASHHEGMYDYYRGQLQEVCNEQLRRDDHADKAAEAHCGPREGHTWQGNTPALPPVNPR